MAVGNIHSFESTGLVDGPGIRTVVFLQGCTLRCRYCHNPDTWPSGGGTMMTARALVDRLLRYQPYYRASGGGVTFSGGEPLCQPDFLAEALRLCREEGIHTCLDTAGVGFGDYSGILENTDLLLYDVKHYDPVAYRELTGRDMAETSRFIRQACQLGVPLWIRHVVVPGLTDGEAHIRRLAAFIRTLDGVQRVELLGYHLLGVAKYAALNLSYSLPGVPAMDASQLAAYQLLLEQELEV